MCAYSKRRMRDAARQQERDEALAAGGRTLLVANEADDPFGDVQHSDNMHEEFGIERKTERVSKYHDRLAMDDGENKGRIMKQFN